MAFIDSGKTFDKDENYGKMKKRLEGMDITQYSFRIPSHIHKKVKVKLAKEGKSLHAVLMEAVEQYLNK